MKCPLCAADSRVLLTDGGTMIKRRRQCVHCRHRFNTVEIASQEHDALLASDATIQFALKHHLAKAG